MAAMPPDDNDEFPAVLSVGFALIYPPGVLLVGTLPEGTIPIGTGSAGHRTIPTKMIVKERREGGGVAHR